MLLMECSLYAGGSVQFADGAVPDAGGTVADSGETFQAFLLLTDDEGGSFAFAIRAVPGAGGIVPVANEAVPNADGIVPASCGAVPDARSNQYYCQGTVFDGGKTRHIAGNVLEVERDVLSKYLEAFSVAAPNSSLSDCHGLRRLALV